MAVTSYEKAVSEGVAFWAYTMFYDNDQALEGKKAATSLF